MEPQKQDIPDAWHDKTRTQPYPKMSNELYINPSPLIVPQEMKKGEFLQFQLSQDDSFGNENTITSELQRWCMYNPHFSLSPGKWFWRYRNVCADQNYGEWSESIPFEVKDDTPVFLTPVFETFKSNLPKQFPRLYCFLSPYMSDARAKVTSHPEFKALVSRAKSALDIDYSSLMFPFSELGLETVAMNVEYLYQAYMITEDEQYLKKMEEIFMLFIDNPYSDSDLFKDNFSSTNIAYGILAPYDLLYDKLPTDKKSIADELLYRIAEYYFRMYCGMQENHIFDNHFWQKNMRVLFQIALCMYDNPSYADIMLEMLEYYYELWTARAPASGFNRDGAWINGTGYFEANVRTLYYMPMILSYITHKNFLLHPWYINAGQSLVYSWLPDSKSAGFGDGSEKRDEPGRQRAAFADFLAREIGDKYAGWYAGKCSDLVKQDVDLRLYRMVRSGKYDTSLPSDAPKLKWYKDIGEVVIHSDLEYIEDNISLSFRSSTFGSGSHTLADQNSFNILYGGKEVYYHSGYYLNFSDAHNLMSYRHTRAHNTILIDGIGQPFSTKGYGMIMRAGSGNNISYCLGDASNAYSGISDDELWINAFEKAGISQTPEFGFGCTPLTKYRRQMLMLHPNIILIYDELEASSSVKWEWLLHSKSKFNIEGSTFSSRTENGGTAVAYMFCEHSVNIAQTDKFIVPPSTISGSEYPNQWHLTATVEGKPECRFLTIVQILDSGKSALNVIYNNGCIECGQWKIDVNLSCDKPEKLLIRNLINGAIYSYGSENLSIDGELYYRKYSNSSILYDKVNGIFTTDEQTDAKQISSRISF
ncbi:DUF4962 domain-containing protein [Bacteroides caecigallinarum]|nr:DUF4962 domain-containing protein [Bacteroides caecigallinarum]